MMREYDSFPFNNKKNLKDILQSYFQTCSITVDCEMAAIIAATLANGGTNPLTKDKIFKPEHVRDCLSITMCCGM